MVQQSTVQKGNLFEIEASRELSHHFGWTLHQSVGIGIGNPPKRHRFDLVDIPRKVAVECKAFTWTVTGNMPSAKITTAREAVLYLQWLPDDWTKVLAMARSLRGGYEESLAEYFVRLNGHLLGAVSVVEVDAGEAQVLHGRLAS